MAIHKLKSQLKTIIQKIAEALPHDKKHLAKEVSVCTNDLRKEISAEKQRAADNADVLKTRTDNLEAEYADRLRRGKAVEEENRRLHDKNGELEEKLKTQKRDMEERLLPWPPDYVELINEFRRIFDYDLALLQLCQFLAKEGVEFSSPLEVSDDSDLENLLRSSSVISMISFVQLFQKQCPHALGQEAFSELAEIYSDACNILIEKFLDDGVLIPLHPRIVQLGLQLGGIDTVYVPARSQPA